MTGPIRINPALVAALEHYAEGRYNPMQPSLYVHTTERGRHRHQSPWPLERTCGLAAEILQEEGLAFLELRVLKAAMKGGGLEKFYERALGKPLVLEER